MKDTNKETVKVVLTLMILIMVVIFGFFMYKKGELSYYNENAYINNFVNKKWYSVLNNDMYEMVEFTSSKVVNYIYYDRIDNVGTFSGCNVFIYTLQNDTFKVLCDQNKVLKVKVLGYNDNKLVLSINNNKHIYYSSLENMK